MGSYLILKTRRQKNALTILQSKTMREQFSQTVFNHRYSTYYVLHRHLLYITTTREKSGMLEMIHIYQDGAKNIMRNNIT